MAIGDAFADGTPLARATDIVAEADEHRTWRGGCAIRRAHLWCLAHALALTIPLSASNAAAQEDHSVEVRIEPLTNFFQISRTRNDPATFSERELDPALNFATGVGIRVFGRRGRGATFEVLRSHEFPWSEFRSGEGAPHPTLVGYAGYARRWLHRRTTHRHVALTPHVAIAVGHELCHERAHRIEYADDHACPSGRKRIPLLGLRAGFDFDFHHRRFIIGFSARYGFLLHFRPSELRYSHRASFDILPRFGITFGAGAEPES